MEQYLQRTYLAGLFNRIGLGLLVLALSCAWFVYLWGLQWTAIIAGVALGILVLLCIRLFNKRTVDLRQEQLRRRIGGELAVNALLLTGRKQAHFQVSLWLSMAYPLQMEKSTEEGLVAELKGKKLLISAICRHESEKITCDDLIRLQKALITCHGDKAVACVTTGLSDGAKGYVETAKPPISIVDKKELIHLAGTMLPATNEQLVELGQSKKRHGSKSVWIAHVLDESRAKRYLLYGLGLLGLYFITKLPYYPVPGAIMLSLAVLSKVYPRKEKTL